MRTRILASLILAGASFVIFFAVPGNVLGFELAHRKFGSKACGDLLEPAVQLAANGYPVSYMRAQGFRAARPIGATSSRPRPRQRRPCRP